MFTQSSHWLNYLMLSRSAVQCINVPPPAAGNCYTVYDVSMSQYVNSYLHQAFVILLKWAYDCKHIPEYATLIVVEGFVRRLPAVIIQSLVIADAYSSPLYGCQMRQ